MEKNIKKISDVSLEKVSGGENEDLAVVGGMAALAACVTTPVSIGTSIASAVCQSKAKKNREQGNAGTAQKLEKAGRVLSWSSVGAGSVASACWLMTGYVFYRCRTSDA